MPQLKVCTECNKPTTAVVPPSRPKAGEFYCSDCHKSYRMVVIEEAEYWMNQGKV